MVPHPTQVFHITHINNLPSIITDDGLRACADLRSGRENYTDIAHQHIQDRRAQIIVPCGPGGNLHEYVPFYFAPRSPMLYAICKGQVAGYNGKQEEIIYLVSSVQAVEQSELSFVFTDGHATKAFTGFYDDLSRLTEVDWKIMRARHWADTPEDGDRKRRRQAEYLVHRFFPWKLISEIGVSSEQMAEQLIPVLSRHSHQPLVRVQKGWYY